MRYIHRLHDYIWLTGFFLCIVTGLIVRELQHLPEPTMKKRRTGSEFHGVLLAFYNSLRIRA